jgi:hypothetical protein
LRCSCVVVRSQVPKDTTKPKAQRISPRKEKGGTGKKKVEWERETMEIGEKKSKFLN